MFTQRVERPFREFANFPGPKIARTRIIITEYDLSCLSIDPFSEIGDTKSWKVSIIKGLGEIQSNPNRWVIIELVVKMRNDVIVKERFSDTSRAMKNIAFR